jgi:hypothetical protein
MKRHLAWYRPLLAIVGLILLAAPLFPQQVLSRARIVRLSYVSGTVAVRHPGSTEWTNASVNTPIQEGFEIATASESYAEVEFENGSSARLGELSKVEFSQLALDEEGNKLNHLTFEQGYATFHFIPEHHDACSVKVADATLTPRGDSEFRTDLVQEWARVEVFSGTTEVTARSGSVNLGKERVLEFDPRVGGEGLNVQEGITKDSWDKWVEARDTQRQLALQDQAVAAPGLNYGWSDLDAYGEWANIPGYGPGWAPYVPIGWTPYSMGMWGYYPGFGLTWISSEPWGWLPYHCGWWSFDPLFGWFWMPESCSYLSPALVTWYTGPGWIGWSPKPHPGPGRPIHPRPHPGLESVTAVRTSVFQNGELITPQLVTHVRPADGTLLDRPPYQPPLLPPAARLTAKAEAALHGSASHPFAHGTPAPATILMGGDEAKERALLAARPSTLERMLGFSLEQPLRAREGSTLGGRYAVGGSPGEFRGEAFSRGGGTSGIMPAKGSGGAAIARGAGAGGPQVLAHGQSAAAFSGGGSGGGGHSSGGAVATGASSSAHSASTSAAAPSASGSSSASGGHH